MSAAAFEGSRPLYLCNAPFERPSSPEHFLSTDGTCEGRQMVGLLGHIGTSRDGRTPRSLLRCTRTVKSPLLTNRRHVATVDFDDCRDDTIEAVLGYVR